MVILLQLPLEVVCSIAGLLPGASLLLLRQTCRDMNTKTWKVFEREYFESRNVMLQHQSLRNLQDISEYPTLRRAVRTLRLCTEHLSDSDDDGIECGHDPFNDAWGFPADPLQADMDHSPPWLEDSTTSVCACALCDLRQRMREQEAFLFGEDRRCLVQVMRNLPNCKTLVLTDAHVPWGAARLEREVGCVFERGLDSCYFEEGDFIKHVLDVMLIAVAESKLAVEKLDIYLGHRDEPKSIQPMSVQLLDAPEHNMLGHDGLKILSLTSLRMILSPWPGNQGGPDWEPSFTRFLALFPQLSDFTLAFDGEEQYDDHEVFPRISRVLSIPHLRVVDLARFEATVPELEEVLLRHQQTLKEVTLREVKLRGVGSWPSLLSKLWGMSGVRLIIVTNCLMEDEWMTDMCHDMPNVVSITDEGMFAKVVGWIEDGSKRMVNELEVKEYM